MQILKHIYKLISSLVKQIWPQSMAMATEQERQQIALHRFEAERLDRIRNPSKYLGKG